MFLIVYLYAVRKIWPWLGRQGSARHWLDFHVLLGITAPILVTFHSAFKFSGLAGVAFWLMVIVAISGIVGRYIYAQIPRSLSFAEVSLKEANEQSGKMAEQLKGLGVLSAREVDSLVRLPNLQQSENMSLLNALWKMMVFDMEFPFRIMRLRQKMLCRTERRCRWWVSGALRMPSWKLPSPLPGSRWSWPRRSCSFRRRTRCCISGT